MFNKKFRRREPLQFLSNTMPDDTPGVRALSHNLLIVVRRMACCRPYRGFSTYVGSGARHPSNLVGPLPLVWSQLVISPFWEIFEAYLARLTEHKDKVLPCLVCRGRIDATFF